MTRTEIEIRPRGSFSWAAACEVGRNFAPISHNWREGDVVPMTFPLDGDFTPVGVGLRWQDGCLVGEVTGTSSVDRVARQVSRIFSLDADGTGYEAVGARDARIDRLMKALPGLRPVCFTSPYETAVWAIISQRISMRQAAVIKARITAEHGTQLRVGGVDVGCFPSPERLLNVTQVPGLAAEKVARLHGVARAALVGLLDADRLRSLGDEEGPASLRTIPGIGPFWASGIYLRGAGIQDVFPDEPIAIAALGSLYGLGDQPASVKITELTATYSPFRMWVCFLLRVAVNRGLIEGVAGREGGIRDAARR